MDGCEVGLALGAFVKLMRASSSVSARAHRPLAGESLSESQFGVMEALLHRGPLCQRDLAAKILKTGGNVTLVVDNLQRQGLVERRRDQQDRRLVTVHLTDQGREVIERVYPRMVEAIVQEMKVLSSEELATLADLCRRLGRGKQTD